MTNFIMIRYHIDSLVDDTVFADIVRHEMFSILLLSFVLF